MITHSAELDKLATALAAAQSHIVGAVKDSANTFFKSEYADLESVWKACRAQLTGNGLSVTQFPTQADGGGVGLTTMLLHDSGQWLMATATAVPKDGGAQSVGSVITYLRRYALAAVAGVPQIDDDGEAGEARTKKQPAPVAQAAKPAASASAHVETGIRTIGPTTITRCDKRQSKPDAAKPWSAVFITLADGSESGTFDTKLAQALMDAHASGSAVYLAVEPSKKDPAKTVVVGVELAEHATVPTMDSDDGPLPF